MKYKIMALAILIVASASFNTVAQVPDSLQRYMIIAAENNPALMQKYVEYHASLEKIPQVGALPDPELTAGVFLSPMELMSGNQIAELSLMQMFPWFGVLKNAKDEMSLMAMANYEAFKDAKLGLFYDVQRTWYEVYLLREQLRIADKNIAILQTIERLALARFRQAPVGGGSSVTPTSTGVAPQGSTAGTGSNTSSGMNNMGGGQSTGAGSSSGASSSMQGGSMSSSTGGSPLADLYRVQIEIGELENSIALLKNNQETITARFNALLNRPATSVIYLPDTLIADTLAISWDAVSDSILANNPMLLMLHYEQESLEARRVMNSRMGYPMVGLGLNYSLINESMMSTSDMNGVDMIMPMVKLTLPIYRKKYRAMKKEAELLKSASSFNYKNTANSLNTEFYAAMQTYLDAQRRLTLYGKQLALSRKSLDIMIRSFSATGAGLTDILRVRQQNIDYDLKQVQALTDFNSSIAYIKRLMSNIDDQQNN